MRVRVPDASIITPYLSRGFRLWMVIRIAMAVVGVVTGIATPSDLLAWDLGGAVAVLGACAALGLIDTTRRGERRLLANLGVTQLELAAMFVLPAATGELFLAIALGQ